MSSDNVDTTPLETPSSREVGRVKWFNNKTGYGFITITDGPKAGTDVFVHHSGVLVSNEQYKYLVQGEYVNFKLDYTPSGAHEYQAGEVSGINGGKLMCETRRDFRQSRATHKSMEEPSAPRASVAREQASSQTTDEVVLKPRTSRPPSGDVPVRARGAGPRDGQDGGSWTLVSGDSKRKPGDKSTAGRGRGRPPKLPVAAQK